MVPGSSISIRELNEEFLVTEVISDSELRIKQKKEALESVDKQFSFKILPKLDQSDMYKHVWNSLNNDEVILIFPEGGSHDRTDLLPLKAGVCIMAFGAMNQYNKSITIVPCGLNYFQGHKFRSKVIMNLGVPYQVP